MNNAIFRLAAAFCLVSGGALCFHRFACNPRSAEGPGPHILPAEVFELPDALRLSADLQARVENNHRRIQAKHKALCELLDGRLTLLETAARFRELDAGLPEVRDRLRRQYPGTLYEVALCRDVIENARSEVRLRDPEKVDSVIGRLEADLNAHLESEAGLQLP